MNCGHNPSPMGRCRGCGKTIMWGQRQCPSCEGKGCERCRGNGALRVPLDLKAPVFEVTGHSEDGRVAMIQPAQQVFVSHFATCSHANEFSRGNRQRRGRG